MITIFNRKELFITYSMGEQSKVRNILEDNQIDYYVKTINRKSPSPLAVGTRGRTGTFGENLNLEYEYIIYVRKQDLEAARHLLMKRKVK